MNILTEIGWSHKPGGARRVAANILTEMIHLRPEHRFTICANGLLGLTDLQTIEQISCPPRFGVPQVIWDQFIFPHWSVPRTAQTCKADVVLYTNNYISRWGNIPGVVIIHDLTPFTMPEAFHRLHGAYQRYYMRLATERAAGIITVSEHSREDIHRILGVSRDRIIVAPNAANRIGFGHFPEVPSAAIGQWGIRGPYILYVGAIHPRKNVAGLLQAFAKLKTDQRIPHQLVIVGDKLWMADSLRNQPAFRAVAEDVIFTGRVSDRDLPGLYRQSALFVYPSFYEGFGLPVLEAMAFGAPVVTSNTSSLPEVVGDAGILVDPHNIGEMASGMYKVLADPDLAATMRLKGQQRAQTFSWQKTARIIMDVLESVAKTNQVSIRKQDL